MLILDLVKRFKFKENKINLIFFCIFYFKNYSGIGYVVYYSFKYIVSRKGCRLCSLE